MGATTGISWTDSTWNPVRGCSRVSPGCDHCYAMNQAHRFSGAGKPFEGLTTLRKGKVDWSGKVRLVPEMLDVPLRWKKPRRIFVNSMSDLFHEALTNEEIAAVFGVMAAAPQHTFQVLTKRAKRMREWFQWVDRAGGRTGSDVAITEALGVPALNAYVTRHDADIDDEPGAWDHLIEDPPDWPLPNVWLGVSVEDQQRADERIPLLLQTPAAVRFVSAEPLLGPLDLSIYLYRGVIEAKPGDADYDALNWVIAGGESGHGARPFCVEWARSLRDACMTAGVACFVKQFGRGPFDSTGEKLALRDSHGGDWSEWPEDLRVRQFPEVPHA